MLTGLLVLASRIRALFGRERLDADFTAEMQSHLAMLEEESVRRGVPADEARRLARVTFGGPMQTLEHHRDGRGLPLLETTAQDLRFALRSLRKQPGFSLVVVLTLAIGVGAITSMFTVVRAVLLKPLPYREAGRLVELTETNPLKGWTHTVTAPANVLDWRARNTAFTDIAGYIGVDDRGASQMQRFIDINGEPQPINGVAVTGNVFDVLGVSPLLGRTLTWDETFEGRDRVLVLSYGAWQTLFAGDAAVVGRTVSLSGRTMTVIGVMPREFFFPNRTAQFWAPIGISRERFAGMRRPHWLNTIARLRPGVSIGEARDQMRRIAADLERTYPDTNTQMGVRLEPLHDIMAADARPAILLLFAAVAVLFLIVCVNLASLHLGRGASRMREIAVRRALGAGRLRLVRQLLTEALVLSALGALGGIALAMLSPLLLERAAPSALPLYAVPRVDAGVVVFAALVAAIAPLLFALPPALASSRNDRLSERTETASRETTRTRDALVACEVALSVVLVIGSMLLIRSLQQLQRVDPGFGATRVVTFKVTLPSVKYPKGADQTRVFGEIERLLSTQPAVTAVGATRELVLRGYSYTSDATPEGRTGNDYEREMRFNSVTPDYFRAIGARLIAGRWFTARDNQGDSPAIIVNEALARRYYGTLNVLGKRLKPGKPTDRDPWLTIVGVVGDMKQDGMDKPVRPEMYAPFANDPTNPATFVVRSTTDAAAVMGMARRIVRGVDRDLLVTDVATIADVVHDSVRDERFRTTLLSAFAGMAQFLAALGIYGVLAYFVSQRSRELGIRLALGARPAELFRLVVGRGMRPVLAGAAFGIPASYAAAGVMRSLLFGVSTLDPAAYLLSIGGLVAIATAACAIPAGRATRVDPVVALRQE